MNNLNNLPRQKLCEIIKIYGIDACSDHRRIRGLLNDFCNGNYPEINFLLTALEEHVYTELVTSSKTVPYEMVSARLVERLYTKRGMAKEFAHWAVDSWALALGIISYETSYTKPQVSLFDVPQSGTANAAKSYANTTVRQTIVVSPTRGQYTSISTAISCAPPNTLILVKPGYYDEGFIINKRVEIRGDGPREQIIIESRDTSCIQMETDEALVQGLTLRCHARLTNKKHAVDIPMGRLKLIECDITSDTLACVAIRGHSTHPEIWGCWLHDAADGSGLFIEKNAQGIIENCHIYGNSYPNIAIMPYANPIVRKCKIYGGKNHGILVWEKGIGTIEDCDIFGNVCDGVKARDGGVPIVRGCHIYRNGRQEGWVYQNGMGNTNFPAITEPPGIRQQRGNSEIRSEAISTNVEYITQNAVWQQEIARQQATVWQPEKARQQAAARQQEITQQPEERPSLINLFLRSIGFSKEK